MFRGLEWLLNLKNYKVLRIAKSTFDLRRRLTGYQPRKDIE